MGQRARSLGLIGLVMATTVAASATPVGAPTARLVPVTSNESNALATLKELVISQEKFRTGLKIDEDQDGVGEYGSIGELAGVCWLMRHWVGVGWPQWPPLLPLAFQTIDADGFATSSGYHFVIFLPNNAVAPVGLKDVPFGGAAPQVDPNNCEKRWCAYAWPVNLGVGATTALFVNQSGVILRTKMDACQYNGATAAPHYSAAFAATGMQSPLAIPPVSGVDGNTWSPVP
jgi:hypothetical protein